MNRKHDRIKQHGVHYTPPELASFLARVTLAAAKRGRGQINVLDPACGDGALLYALAQAAPKTLRGQLHLCGFEQDQDAAKCARQSLDSWGVGSLTIYQQDFLDVDKSSVKGKYDMVIANPPYVRTQVLGAQRAQKLGKEFDLTGRVDLYHAFSVAMAHALRTGGVLGLLTSNRFLTIKSGIGLRRFLANHFQLRSVFDLGDTRLFKAAVLPVIVVGEKRGRVNPLDKCQFRRAYRRRPAGESAAEPQPFAHVLDALEHPTFAGLAQTESGRYQVEKGHLNFSGEDDEIWSLSTPENTDWLASVRRHRKHTFEDVVHIRVGIKTTADAVFIREDWQALPEEVRPERKLIHSLITHHHAARWRTSANHQKSVLYPHESKNGKRLPIRLERYPKAASYLQSHAARLRSRKYVLDGGREWFEIWVPHHPDNWAQKKVVFPDIAERPTFFLDESGAIVNGDCYWITLRPDFDNDWLYLVLAVANSSLVTQYYDVVFHNKLYAGRRRFMTQYVKQFPLPDLATRPSKTIVQEVKKLLATSQPRGHNRLEARIDYLVWKSFGFERSMNTL